MIVCLSLILSSWFLGTAAQAAEHTPERDQAQALAELRTHLFAVDLVVHAHVANVVPAGDRALVVLAVRETFRGPSMQPIVYAETARALADGLADRDALWLLHATEHERHFLLDGPDAILDPQQAPDVTKALETTTFATLNELTLTIELNAPAFAPDEPIALTWTITNPTANPIEIVVPEGWGTLLGLILVKKNPGRRAKNETIIDLRPGSRPLDEAAPAFRTLAPNRPPLTGTTSLLTLLARVGGADFHGRPGLPEGTYEVTLVIDTTGLDKKAADLAPQGAAFGRLTSEPVSLEVTTKNPLTLEQAAGAVARFAGVDSLSEAVESDDADIRTRTFAALVDYATPALLPFYEELLRSSDAETRTAACNAIVMWARHPAVIEARPFADLIDELPLETDLSTIARATADLAQAQQDATVLPLLLRLMQAETVNDVIKQYVALTAASIAGIDIDETDLEHAELTLRRWIDDHPELVAPE